MHLSFYLTLIYVSISYKFISHSGSCAGQCIWGFFLRHVLPLCLLILIICQLNGDGNLYIIIQINPLVCAIWQIEYLMTISGNHSCYTYKSAQGIIENLPHFCSICWFFSCYAMERKRQLKKKETWKMEMNNKQCLLECVINMGDILNRVIKKRIF